MYGKEIVGVKHKDAKIVKGGFLLYSYTDEYLFPKQVVKKAVSIIVSVVTRW